MIYLTLAIFFLAATSQYSKAASSCHMREIDLCLATIMLSAADGVPGNEEDLDRSCEPALEGFECIENYSKSCFTEFMQEMFNMIAAEPKKIQTQLCTHGTDERAQYLRNAPCFQNVLSNDNIRPHIEDMMAAMEAATEAPFDKRVPIMCCGMQRLFNTATDLVRDECGDAVFEEGSAVLGVSISGLSEMFCRGYEPGTPKCDGILPPAGTPSKGVDSNNQLIRFMASALSSFT